MTKTKKIVQVLSALSVSCALPAIGSTQADNNLIASNCRSYLVQYGDKGSLPAHVAKTAAPALSQCVVHNSCANKNLSNIPNCALKLSNLSMDAQLADVTTTESTPSKMTAPQYTAPQTVQPVKPYSPPTETEQQNQTKPADPTKQKPQKKQPEINWF